MKKILILIVGVLLGVNICNSLGEPYVYIESQQIETTIYDYEFVSYKYDCLSVYVKKVSDSTQGDKIVTYNLDKLSSMRNLNLLDLSILFEKHGYLTVTADSNPLNITVSLRGDVFGAGHEINIDNYRIEYNLIKTDNTVEFAKIISLTDDSVYILYAIFE